MKTNPNVEIEKPKQQRKLFDQDIPEKKSQEKDHNVNSNVETTRKTTTSGFHPTRNPNADSQRIDIEKPIKQKNSNIFDQPIIQIEKNTSKNEEKNFPTVEEKNTSKNEEKKQIEISLNSKGSIDVETLKKIRPPYLKNIPLKSRGYTLLKNYLKEMQNNDTSNFNSKNYQILKSLQNNDATLLDAGKNSFVPTILQKNVDEWDDNSETAFRMHTKTILNRLALQNIDESISELFLKSNENRINFIVETFINKASSEKSFSHVYAKFVKQLSVNEKYEVVSETIIQDATDYFSNLISNAKTDSSEESEVYIGYAVFIGNLIRYEALQNGDKYLKELINELPNGNDDQLNIHIIEMIFNFLKSAGDNFIRANYGQLGKIEEILKNRKNIKSLHKFILIDTLEIISNAMRTDSSNTGINNNQDNDKKERNIDELKSKVRNGFASYLEDYTVLPNDVSQMSFVDFFEGSMVLFIDIHDVFYFTYYQCFVLKKLGYNSNEIIKLLIKYIQIFTQQNIVSDCPRIWVNYSIILSQMMIHNIISIDEAKLVHSEITKLNRSTKIDDYDPINDIKYLINDYFDFSEAFEFDSPNYPSPDINFALKLPKTIDNPNIEIPAFPRIVCVGIIKSVFYKLVNESENQSVEGLEKWKNLLSKIYSKHPDLFKEIVTQSIKNYELDFECDDVIKFCSE